MEREGTRVTLEEYLHFYQDPWLLDLPRIYLNQIVAMHGFRKLHHESKRLIVECLDSIELMPPARSTLEQNISSRAFLTVDQVAADLDTLGWKECTVRSLRILRSEALQAYVASIPELPTGSTSARSGSTSAPRARLRRQRHSRAPPAATFIITGQRPRSKRKRASINALTAASSTTSCADFRYPPPPSYPPPPTPPPPCSPSSPPPPTPTPPPPASPPSSIFF